MGTEIRGRFEVALKPQTDDGVGDPTLSRLELDKVFHGALEATSKGQMLASISESVAGSAAYVALERVRGMLEGRRGSFVLQHSGQRTRGVPTLTISVVPDSGTEELVGLSGTMRIEILEGGEHFYVLDYALEPR